MLTRRAVAALLPSLIALSACSDSSGPGPIDRKMDATFALATVDGESLPAPVEILNGAIYIVLADTLRFSIDGELHRTMHIREIGATAEATQDSQYVQEMVLPYRVQGDRLTIGYDGPCAPNANCIGSERGTFGPLGLTIVDGLFWRSAPVLLFLEVD